MLSELTIPQALRRIGIVDLPIVERPMENGLD
jgi:hypothetical protein